MVTIFTQLRTTCHKCCSRQSI